MDTASQQEDLVIVYRKSAAEKPLTFCEKDRWLLERFLYKDHTEILKELRVEAAGDCVPDLPWD